MSIESTVAVATQFSNKSYDKFSQDLADVGVLQLKFNKELGIEKAVRLNYNPVLARANFERLTSDNRRQNFRNYELWQIQTALRERNHAAKSSVNYLIDEHGEMRNELFPDEPFSHILERGLAYRKSIGSKELEREYAEYEGWLQVCNVLKHPDTPAGAKFIAISCPGIVADTNYNDNFVDIYEAHDDPVTGKRYITMTRNASKLTYGDYENNAAQLQNGYFDNLEGPIDAWYLRNPIYKNPSVDARSTDELFEQIFGHREGAMGEADFQQLWQQLIPVVLYYINNLCAEEFHPSSLAISWNAVLKKNDLMKTILENTKISKDQQMQNTQLQIPQFYGNLHEEIDWLGRQQIDMVAAACGTSGGFKIEYKDGLAPKNPIQELLSNSVAKFGVEEDNYGSLHFDCPHCRFDNKRDYGKLLTKCKSCGEDVTCGDSKEKTSVTKNMTTASTNEPTN
ncbi:hypothetical protein A2861_01815 [Candidatus Roizmanbacteria bacterium RIFCSPHIGHO2_01_FULL_38_15]|nr:MAG: hypothetical protein A2861_01815 [Candidatus Roizmanbacteria bacterium RIFCSPHIGHO2_01_FULL_38_15]OGK34739.1 MAG: hypothetical protein A3F59_04390 [Candidatus Roizmanbacteria bacterium RIFCSPHIGHO2_12_FULL_38_13]